MALIQLESQEQAVDALVVSNFCLLWRVCMMKMMPYYVNFQVIVKTSVKWLVKWLVKVQVCMLHARF
jgi:hypothetical protein